MELGIYRDLGFLIQFPDGADSWTHFKTLLREFLEGDKEEAYAESSQKLTNARQRKTDTVDEFYDFTYKLHIRLRTLDKERAMTDQQFFDYFRARLLQKYRTMNSITSRRNYSFAFGLSSKNVL